MLPTRLFHECGLEEIQINARILAAARAERVGRVSKLLMSMDDPLAQCISLLAELVVGD
jgi:hypothetical protein